MVTTKNDCHEKYEYAYLLHEELKAIGYEASVIMELATTAYAQGAISGETGSRKERIHETRTRAKSKGQFT